LKLRIASYLSARTCVDVERLRTALGEIGTLGDDAASIETLGIEHIPEEKRHGSPGRVFTLWFAANLTIADYVIGVLSVQVFGFTVLQALPILLIGNLLGGIVLGLSAGMGPRLGFPQMLSSRSSFGRRGNYALAVLNWASTVGWFTVNTILGVEAINAVLPGTNFYLAALVLVILQVIIAVYGHDFIHLFEKVMAVALGILFLGIFVLTLPRLTEALRFVPSGGSASIISFGAIGVLLAVSFSYLMSWSPYASDYSRYLARNTSTMKVVIFALVGGASASFAIELIGAIVGSLTPGQGFFEALYHLSGEFGPIAILAILMGALAANALNIYTNALSALVLDIRARRWVMVMIGGAVGFVLSIIGQSNFELNYENFLLVLDYWIMPWLGITLVDYYVSHRTTINLVSNPSAFDSQAIGIYFLSILSSVPFMVPAFPLGFPVGALSSIFGGGDFSYAVSFGAAAGLTYLARRSAAYRKGPLERHVGEPILDSGPIPSKRIAGDSP
jgi:NCS1 family nucleobase:cation symporter-1